MFCWYGGHEAVPLHVKAAGWWCGAVYFLVFVGFGVGLVVVKFGCDCIDQGSDAGSNVGFVVGFNDDIGLNQCVTCFVLINDFDGK